MKQEEFSNAMLGEIVANDFRTAEVFTRHGIDFCCGGKKTLNEACMEKSLNAELITHELKLLVVTPMAPGQNFNDWALDFLCDYIKNSHHKYVLKALPELVFYTQKIASVHGGNHAELIEIASLFTKINHELLQHLTKEEEVLFPAIKEQLLKKKDNTGGIIRSEIARMNGEHEFAGGAMDKINTLTHGYKIPHDACNTYVVTLQLLKQFENDLHIHVHLENNILYPKAIKLTT